MPGAAFRSTLGSWVATDSAPRPRRGAKALKESISALNDPIIVVAQDGKLAVVRGGEARLGLAAHETALPLVAYVPPLSVASLGDAGFRAAHKINYAYVAGEMANGIASEALVEAVARAGMLGVFGAAGLAIPRIEQAMERLESSLKGLPWGVNLIHSPDDPALEADAVELFLKRGLTFASASAYLDLTLPIVKFRLAGIHRRDDGTIAVPNRVMAKVSRVEVARKFLEPAPERFVEQLVADGFLTKDQAEFTARVPMADDITAEADSGGHTDNRPLVVLLPALQALRDEISAKRGYPTAPRVGAAGGIATPASVASAFSMGAAYVVTGSVNQACREAGTSDAVREMLAKAESTDVAMAPAADMFEMGVKVQVLSRGTMFAVRAQRLYELYRGYSSVEALPDAVRAELEQKYFRSTLEEAWSNCEAYFAARDPQQLIRAAGEPNHKLALIFRAYLGQASHWANSGVADRVLDYQVWCGPAMGAFNAWTKGSPLATWQKRSVVAVAKNLLVGAAVLTRAAALRAQGVELPAAATQFSPLSEAALDALLVPSPAMVTEPSIVEAPIEEPIAIIGMGSMFPKAENLEAFWRLLRTGTDAVGNIPASHWTLDDYHDPDVQAPDKTYANRGAFLTPHDFDPTEFGIPPNILEATDTSQLLGLVVARMAMDDAGYGDDVQFDRSRTSVLLGVTGTQELVISLGARLGHPKWKKALREAGVDEETANDVVERISASYVGWQENSFPGLLGNVVAGRIANRFDFGGTNCVIDAACASSLGAVHLAVLELRSKRSDMVLTGGVDCLNDIFMHICFSKTPALSATGDVRPFSDQADGTLLGEGLGMLVLKRLSDAERDGDRIYASIRGVGTSSDGRAKSIYAPLPSGQARALKSAYEQARVRPRDITLLEAHGTGTKAGDAAEFEALNAVYREDSLDPAWCALGSVKSQIGHTKAAAGAVGMMKVALALHHKVFAPTLKVERPNPGLRIEASPFSLSTEARPWLAVPQRPRLAAVSSFGFGGSNFHLVLEEYGARRAAPAWDGSVELFAFSADDANSLVSQVRAASDAAESRKAFRSSHAHRLIALVSVGSSLAMVVAGALETITATPGTAFATPDGVHYGVGPAAGKLAFLFPGQGSQHVNMLRELACVFPELLEAVEGAGLELASTIYPVPTFNPEERTRGEELLTKTDLAQPAIGAVSSGAMEILARFGIQPALVAGHSYGELVALHVAGVFDAGALQAISKLRGSLMAGNGADRGTMLAVLAPLAQIEETVAGIDVVLANRNGPAQGVLSGSRAEIIRAEEACRKAGLRVVPLQVGAAFHSPLVASAAEAFRQGLEEVAFREPKLPVVSNSTAKRWPEAPVEAKDLLSQQLALPVRFDEVVEALFAEGVRTFVEVGPRSALTGMVRANLETRPHVAIALDAQSARGALFDLASVLARVAAAGHDIELESWQQVPLPPRTVAKAPRAMKMSVALSGINYRVQPAPIPPRASRTATPVAAVHAPTATATPVASASLVDALRVNQETIRALQASQEQTARIHQLFLEGQFAATHGLQAMLTGAPASIALPAPIPVTTAATVPSALLIAVAAPVAAMPQIAKVEPIVATHVAIDARQSVLEVVAEATGYPVETLSLDMDLEADLGIDSIKRVEILSMLSKRIPGAPSVNPEKLGALKTLQHVLDFVGAAVPAAAATAAPDNRATVLEVIAEATGYPVETLSLDMDLEADLGIDSIKRVEILSMLSKRIPGAPSVNPEKLGALKTLQQVLDFVSNGEIAASAIVMTNIVPEARMRPEAVDRLIIVAARLAGGGSVVLPAGEWAVVDDGQGFGESLAEALRASGHAARTIASAGDAPAQIAGLIICSPTGAWTELAERSLKDAVLLARALAPQLRENKGMFIALSRRDGAFGHAGPVADDLALHGGLAGLAKTASHEWPEVKSRAIDVSSAFTAQDACAAVVEELSREAPLEVGLSSAGRVTLTLQAQPARKCDRKFKPGDVVVVTGGARGVTADCARALAKRRAVALLLLGRSPEPEPEAAWLADATDDAAIKRAILANAPKGKASTPKTLGEATRAILAAREIRANLRILQSAGIRVRYRSVDVRNPVQLAAVLTETRDELGAIRGLVHGAGVLRDKRIEDKRDDDVDQVVDSKLAALRALLAATADDELDFIALFASVTGRFGRRGQSDYALANQALVSIAQVEAGKRPDCRVVAFDWGPWDGGMVTPALKAEFAREGVALIPIDAGAEAFCDELETAPGGPSEVVYGAGFVADAMPEWTLAAARRLDQSWPLLRDHCLSGRAVLPLALVLEWFVQAAELVHSDCRPAVIENLQVLQGVTISDDPADVSVWYGPVMAAAAGASAVLELRNARDQVCFRAVATWPSVAIAAGPPPALASLAPWPQALADTYATQLFHGPSLEVIEAIEGVGPGGMRLTLRAPATSADLLPAPVVAWSSNPLAVDGVFQAMILWCRSQRGMPSLPSRLGRWTQYTAFDRPSCTATISIREADSATIVADIVFTDESDAVIATIEGYACTMSAALDLAFLTETTVAPSLAVIT